MRISQAHQPWRSYCMCVEAQGGIVAFCAPAEKTQMASRRPDPSPFLRRIGAKGFARAACGQTATSSEPFSPCQFC